MGSSFAGLVITCLIFILSMILIPLSTYKFFFRYINFWVIPVYILQIAIGIPLTIYFVLTGLSDPGIMPKQATNDIIEKQQFEQLNTNETQEENQNESNKLVIESGQYPSIRQFFNVQEQCKTCNFFKPPGCAHCADCDHCVLFHDHCCPWVGNCIGLRNYHNFVKAVTLVSFYCAYCLLLECFGITFVLKNINSQNSEISVSSFEMITSIVFGILSMFGFFFGISMVSAHIQFIRDDVTTRQEIKKKLSVSQQIKQNNLFESIEQRKLFINKLIEQDHVLRELKPILSKKQLSGMKRLKIGRYIPILRNMDVAQAEEIAWRWTIVLGGFDE